LVGKVLRAEDGSRGTVTIGDGLVEVGLPQAHDSSDRQAAAFDSSLINADGEMVML
jgi:hypothetical protein